MQYSHCTQRIYIYIYIYQNTAESDWSKGVDSVTQALKKAEDTLSFYDHNGGHDRNMITE